MSRLGGVLRKRVQLSLSQTGGDFVIFQNKLVRVKRECAPIAVNQLDCAAYELL